jgi:hypothetical protein
MKGYRVRLRVVEEYDVALLGPRVTARALADVPVSYPRCVVCPQNEQQMTLTADL